MCQFMEKGGGAIRSNISLLRSEITLCKSQKKWRVIMTNDWNEVRTALARAVADRNISDEFIDAAAKQIATINYPIRGIDICTVGTCVDFFFEGRDWWRDLQEIAMIDEGRLKSIEIFPYGIIDPDLFHVRVTHQFEGIK